VQKVFSFMQFHLSIFSLNFWAVGILFTTLLAYASVCQCFPYSFLDSFKVSVLAVRALIHFEWMLVQSKKDQQSASLLHQTGLQSVFLTNGFLVEKDGQIPSTCTGLCSVSQDRKLLAHLSSLQTSLSYQREHRFVFCDCPVARARLLALYVNV
jgi:energy-coupling factor transporter transmembrane protein EcfT